MKVKLTYFKPSGKYYACGEYETELLDLHNIFEEVAYKARFHTLPGLVPRHSDYIVLIDVPEHKHNHPALVHTYETIVRAYQERQLEAILER